jgi:ribokinase
MASNGVSPQLVPGSRAFVVGNFVQACCWRVARLPTPGETLQAHSLCIEPGGKGLNVAVGLQRLGARVDTLIGCGRDAAGDALLALLAREGIEAAHIHRFEGASGWGAGLIADDGCNAIAVYPGANLQLGAEHVAAAAAAIESAHLVYGQFETALPAVSAAFARAHALGIATLLNPSPWQEPTESIRHTTHTLIVNEVEALPLLHLSAPLVGPAAQDAACITDHLLAFWSQWTSAQRLLVTLGERGSLAFDRAGSSGSQRDYWHEAAPQITARDTVGAGDAFAAGYCAAWLAGADLSQALRWGNACGAHVASQVGVLDALPYATTLRQLLAGTTG